MDSLGTEVQDRLSSLDSGNELLQDFTENSTGSGVLGQAAREGGRRLCQIKASPLFRSGLRIVAQSFFFGLDLLGGGSLFLQVDSGSGHFVFL